MSERNDKKLRELASKAMVEGIMTERKRILGLMNDILVAIDKKADTKLLLNAHEAQVLAVKKRIFHGCMENLKVAIIGNVQPINGASDGVSDKATESYPERNRLRGLPGIQGDSVGEVSG